MANSPYCFIIFVLWLYSHYLLDTLDGAELLHETFQTGIVVNHDGKVATE